MAKNKTVFFCKNCGYESAKWMGQCPGCREWNTFTEEAVVSSKTSGKSHDRLRDAAPKLLSEISTDKEERFSTGMGELDRVLGGGIVRGSLVLVGGDPGIGKSTIMLQVSRNLSKDDHTVLYVSGEESYRQIRMRADRLGSFSDNFSLFCETELGVISDVIRKRKPEFVVIDSIQTMQTEEIGSAPGSITQVREATGVLMQLAKSEGVTIFLIGHVTKEGVVAGPRVLEHMVDAVLYFEGERHNSYRILRGVKNRFGSTNEIGVFEMHESGLSEVENPSEYLLLGRPKNQNGSVVVCSMEGTRPLLLEIQALVCHSYFNVPRRTSVGTDINRVNLLMAVLEKRLGLSLSSCDAYVNITGGIRINEPALDLGIVLAILSSYREVPLDPALLCFGEVGLSGEIRMAGQADLRIAEARKLGFKRCMLPKASMKGLKSSPDMELLPVSDLSAAVEYIST